MGHDLRAAARHARSVDSQALSAGELHGLGVSRRIEQITAGTFAVARLALPRPPPPRKGGVAQFHVGIVREQPSRGLLPHEERPQAAR